MGQNSPSLHNLHRLHPPGLNCPAPQGLQRVSALPWQDEMTPCPAAHSLHGIHALLAVFEISFVLQGLHVFVPPELNSPSLQGTQCVSTPSEHAATKPSPTAHDLHGIHADLASFAISLRPHTMHLLAPPELISFFEHAMQAVAIAFPREYVPTPQDEQPPLGFMKSPLGQGTVNDWEGSDTSPENLSFSGCTRNRWLYPATIATDTCRIISGTVILWISKYLPSNFRSVKTVNPSRV
jgi:hypothetical protein